MAKLQKTNQKWEVRNEKMDIEFGSEKNLTSHFTNLISHISYLISHRRISQGFTLIELMVVMGIFALMIGFASINLIRPQTQAYFDTSITTLVADLKEQQMRAMTGDGATIYGVRFNSNNYILFTGSSYPLTDNFTINLNSNLQISPNPTTIVFAQRSGETGTATTTLTVTNSASGEHKDIIINNLGGIKIQ